jgi:hypothetical protein
MRVPNHDRAIVERSKIVDYLLNPIHPDNGGKASFFTNLGFSVNEPDILAAAFSELVSSISASSVVESAHGQKYVVDGQIKTPSRRWPSVRTIWIVDRGAELPRLVTAYPFEEKKDNDQRT